MIEGLGVVLKSGQEIERMRSAGRIVALALAAIGEKVRPGVTTAELDALAYQIIIQEGGIPSFKGYRGYPATICTSINEQIVHGIPDQRRLKEGDIVSIDVGAIFQGYHGDAARTFAVGKVPKQARDLLEATEGALAAGIAQAVAGHRLGDISYAIQHHAETRGFTVVREYMGHGIGRDMHEEPQVPNFGIAGQGMLLKPGMSMALEPMLNVGTWRTRILADQWTVVTADAQLSAHFEDTIVVAEDGPEILTHL